MQGFRKDIDNLAFPPLKTKSIQSDEKEKMKQPQQYTPKQLPNEYSWSKVLQKHNQNILRPPPKRRQPFIDWDNINPPTHLFGDSKILYTFPNLSNSQQPPRTISHFPLLPLKPNHGPPQCVKSPMVSYPLE